MKDITYELGHAPIGKLLFRLALPSVLAQLVSLLYTVVDRMYIGHIDTVGTLALTGIGLCLPIVTIINAFTVLIGQGGAPHVSIALGKNQKEHAERILGNCTFCLVTCGVVLSLFFICYGKPILMMFGASDSTIVFTYPYLCIYVLGTIFLMLSFGLNMFITCQGFTKYSMISVLIGAISNIILDPIFIFGLHMGVKGAALATVIAQAFSCIFVLWFIQGKTSLLHIRRSNFQLDGKIMLPVLALGISPFIMQVTEAVLSLSFNFSLQKYGGDIAVGAMTIASTVMQMFWIPANGIGQGAQPIISYNYGAANVDRLKKIVKLLFVVAESFFACCWIIIELFPQVFIQMFNPSPELYETSIWALRVYIGTIGFFGIQNAVQQTFVSTGQAKCSIFIAVLRKVILLIPFIFLLPYFFENKVFAVFLAEPVADFISISVAFCIFMYKFPKILKSMEE